MTSHSDLLVCSETDIDSKLAVDAYNGVSHFPEERGRRTVQDYVEAVESVAQEFAPWATEENVIAMRTDLAHWKNGYRAKMVAYLSASSRCVSSFIAGPSNFPAARMNKRQDTAEKRLREWLDWSKETLDRLRRQYNPRLRERVIRADDDEAAERLRAKIASLEQRHAAMKVVNVTVRGGGTNEQKVAEMMATGFSETEAIAALVPDFMGRTGFADYVLSNSRANIQRLKARLATVEAQAQADEANGGEAREFEFRWTLPSGLVTEGTVIDDPEANRYILRYPGKPEPDIIKMLKARGFHWTPSEGVWQRQRTINAVAAIQELTGVWL